MDTLTITTIPHGRQRYDTAGDYYRLEDDTWAVTISDLGDARYEFLVALHEQIEWFLTQQRGIREETITAFDTGRVGSLSDDPGSLPEAPYHREHLFATTIERCVAKELGVSWRQYEQAFARLEWAPPRADSAPTCGRCWVCRWLSRLWGSHV